MGENFGLDKILQREQIFESISQLTIDLLSYKLEPGHCYTLVTDQLYQDILRPTLFQAISRSTYFIVRIPFNADILSAKEETISALQEARKAGCKCYLMYLANGIQMERFFRFIDRLVKQIEKFKCVLFFLNFVNIFSERAIDTGVSLIILYDYRLFLPSMHYIWKRFINVIFVQQYEQTSRQNNRLSSNKTIFELKTVPYPSPIKQVFVTKTIDFWRNGKYRFGTKLNVDKTKNLNGIKENQNNVCIIIIY